MKIKHRNQFNTEEFPSDNERDFGPSLTVPDQSMSIKEILDRYARGLPMEGKVPIYEGEDGDGIDPRRLDLSERAELKAQYTQELAEIQGRLRNANLENTAPPRTGAGGVDINEEHVNIQN